MVVNFNTDSDIFQLHKDKDFFEWSYFETNFERLRDKYSLIIIGFNGSPLLPEYYENNTRPAVNIVLTKNRNIVSYTLYYPDEVKFEDNILKIGNTFSIQYLEKGERNVVINAKDFNKKSIKLRLNFIPDKQIYKEQEIIGRNLDLNWGLSSLTYSVEGNFNFGEDTFSIKSSGYHDYNCGNSEYLYNNVKEWCWWRVNNSSFKGVYFGIKEGKTWNNFLIYEHNNNILTSNKFILSRSYGRTNLLMKYINKISLNMSDLVLITKSKFNIDFSYVVMGIAFSGILYTRRLNQFSIYINGKEENNIGTFEFFKPKLMKSPFVRRLIKYGLKNNAKKNK